MIEIQTEKEGIAIEDVHTEMQVVASLYDNPDLFLDYGDLIIPKYDFYHETARFLYNSLHEMFHYVANGEITESKINIFMNQDAERKRKYANLQPKGYGYIERIMKIIDPEDFVKYYENLKKYSLLRELEKKGFPAKKIIDKGNFSKVSPEDIIQGMELAINNIGTQIGGVQDSVILGREISKKVAQWKLKPDVGLQIPFDIINMLIRGLRKKKVNLMGMHSGCGKSRLTSIIACFLGIYLGIDILAACNEQDEEEWDAMILSCIINNPCFGFEADLVRAGITGIDETQIVTGSYSVKEEEIINKAAKYIEENSKIHFLELGKFDKQTLKRQFKKHKIKGCQLIIYDTLKAPDHDWQAFVKTGDMLKDEIAKELDISVWGTFQLTDDSLFNEVLNSTAIASGKHIKHVVDGLMMSRPLFYDEYDKFVILDPNGFAGVERRTLDKSQMYYVVYLDKNRGGKDKDKICLRVDKGRNMWIEEGYLVPSDNEKELKRIKKEHKNLKQENELIKLKKALGKEE